MRSLRNRPSPVRLHLQAGSNPRRRVSWPAGPQQRFQPPVIPAHRPPPEQRALTGPYRSYRSMGEEECSMRRLVFLALTLVLSLGLVPLTPGATGGVAAGDRYCFPETKYCAENAFLD